MTEWSTFLAFVTFVCVMSGTPGPGNLTFMAIGAQSGYKAVIRPLAGALLGNAIMGALVAQGVGAVLTSSGTVSSVLKCLCMVYMVYLAWRVMTMSKGAKAGIRELTFGEGFLIHPLSPKTWAMDTIAFSLYFTPTGSLWDETAIFAGIFFLGGLTFHSIWALMGAKLMDWLGQGRSFQYFTACMALLMVGTTAWSLLSQPHV